MALKSNIIYTANEIQKKFYVHHILDLMRINEMITITYHFWSHRLKCHWIYVAFPNNPGRINHFFSSGIINFAHASMSQGRLWWKKHTATHWNTIAPLKSINGYFIEAKPYRWEDV